jgi:hypothetical protein
VLIIPWIIGLQGRKTLISERGSSRKGHLQLVCSSSKPLPAQFRAYVECSALPGRQDADIDFQHSLPSSQRHKHLRDVGLRTMRPG